MPLLVPGRRRSVTFGVVCLAFWVVPVAAIPTFAACGHGDVGDAGPPSDAGVAESASDANDGVAVDAWCNAGTATFHLSAAPGSTWSVTELQMICPMQENWLQIGDDAGHFFPGGVSPDCATCIFYPSPILCYLVKQVEEGGVTATWDGTFLAAGMCGDATVCTSHSCAPPGRYVATMCACPTRASDGPCLAPPPNGCFTVPFDFPSSTPVTATLQ
jgi:hypothetical protein